MDGGADARQGTGPRGHGEQHRRGESEPVENRYRQRQLGNLHVDGGPGESPGDDGDGVMGECRHADASRVLRDRGDDIACRRTGACAFLRKTVPILPGTFPLRRQRPILRGMEPIAYEVFRVLSASGARAERTLALPDGQSLTCWRNENGQATYHNPGHHALSVYLEGGQETRRIAAGRAIQRGFPGAACIFPGDDESRWRFRAPFRFLHLYFRQDHLARTLERVWDAESGACEPDPAYLVADGELERAARLMLAGDWSDPGDSLGVDHIAQWMLIHVARSYTRRPRRLPPVPGRLSPAHAARVRDYIHNHLAEALTLDQLASVAGVSTYHFARLFRATFGEPPYRYVQRCRMTRARELLQHSDEKILAVALQCGFADHSQFSRAFRRHFGVSPRALRGGKR